jgi:hypothetical protein
VQAELPNSDVRRQSPPGCASSTTTSSRRIALWSPGARREMSVCI